EALELIADPDFTTELAQFNVEINIPPRLLSDGVFSELERAVRASLNAAEDQARGAGAHMMLVGILPTISDRHLNVASFSANPRAKSRPHFPTLQRVCAPEDPVEPPARGHAPRIGELRLHNGTVYRWNRPVYDLVREKPHLRVENRVLPAGPPVGDTLAKAAF